MFKIADAFGSAISSAVRKAIDVTVGQTHAPAAPAAPGNADAKRQMEVAKRVMEQDRDLLRELAKR
jgi:hypothetical protein